MSKIPKSVRLLRKLEQLREIEVRVNGKVQKFDLSSEFRLTAADVEDKMYVEAEQYAFWRSLLVRSRQELRALQYKLDKAISEAEVGLRLYAEQENEPWSEWEIKHRVQLQNTVKNARKKLDKKKTEVETLEMMVTGMEFLRSMTMLAASAKKRTLSE